MMGHPSVSLMRMEYKKEPLQEEMDFRAMLPVISKQ
jgi:hypothetical protein